MRHRMIHCCSWVLFNFLAILVPSAQSIMAEDEGHEFTQAFRLEWMESTGINQFLIKGKTRIPIHLEFDPNQNMLRDSLHALNSGLRIANTGTEHHVSKLWIVGMFTEEEFRDPSTHETAPIFLLKHWFLEQPFLGVTWKTDPSLPSHGYYVQASPRNALRTGDFEAWFVEKYPEFNPTHHLQPEPFPDNVE
jgi:hypothetical protein